MQITRLDHYNIDTAKPQETIDFYERILGFRNAPERRPPIAAPGAWILVGDHPALHVNFVEVQPDPGTGAFNHIAFEATGYAALRAHLDANGIDYRAAESPDGNLRQIFLHDPNGVRLELNVRGEI